MVGVRKALVVLGVLAAALTAACSSSSDAEPGDASAQASPSPSPSADAPSSPAAPAASAPQGTWKITVSSDSSYYPRGSSTQQVTIRIVCAAECVGSLETESGVVRAVRWDGERLLVRLPTDETGAARCFDADGTSVPGSATMNVRRSQELPLVGSEPANGMPTRLAGSYPERVRIDEQTRGCGFPTRFSGRWSWELRSLDATSDEGAA